MVAEDRGACRSLTVAARINFEEGVSHGDDDSRDTGGEDGVGAGRGFADMAAGFERDIEGCPPHVFGVFGGRAKGVDFRVRAAEVFVIAFGNDPVALRDDGADHGIRFDVALTVLGERECAVHAVDVEGREDWHPMDCNGMDEIDE